MTRTSHTHLWALGLLLITALLTGCSSAVGINGDKPNGFAHIEIEGSDEATIKAAAIEVFSNEEGFKVVSDLGNQVRFTKPGTKGTTILYGTSFNTDSTAIEPVLSIEALNNGNHRLHCEVYVMEHMNNGDVKPGWRVLKSGRHGYMKLLKEVKALAEK